jgi:hypothetical protein
MWARKAATYKALVFGDYRSTTDQLARGRLDSRHGCHDQPTQYYSTPKFLLTLLGGLSGPPSGTEAKELGVLAHQTQTDQGGLFYSGLDGTRPKDAILEIGSAPDGSTPARAIRRQIGHEALTLERRWKES